METGSIARRVFWAPADVLWGAAWFWIPDILVHAIAPRYAPVIGLLIFSWLLPVTTLVGLKIMSDRRRGWTNRALIALAMIFGIWVLGPSCTALNLNFSGGTFDAETIGALTAIFPLSMLDLSTYDGTLLALFLTTLTLLFSASTKLRLPKWFLINQQ
jgi:hypothetical protein